MDTLEMLQAAAARRLVVLLDCVDREHVVVLDPAREASQVDTRQACDLRARGLLQLADQDTWVPGAGRDVLGVRLLPTEAGLGLLERLRGQVELAAVAQLIGGAA